MNEYDKMEMNDAIADVMKDGRREFGLMSLCAIGPCACFTERGLIVATGLRRSIQTAAVSLCSGFKLS